MRPPYRLPGSAGFQPPICGQIGDHQDKDQQRDHAGLVRQFLAQPAGPDSETPERETDNADAHADGEYGDHGEINPAEATLRRHKWAAESDGKVVQRDQGKGAESPEYKGMRKPRQRSLADHFPLQHDFPDEPADARRN